MYDTTRYFLVKCGGYFYVTSDDLQPSGTCSPSSYIAKSGSVSSGQNCPTDSMGSVGWEVEVSFLGMGSWKIPVTVATTCTCACDTVSIQAAQSDGQETAMTLYMKDATDVNGRPAFTSKNGKRLFHDSSRWRVAADTAATSGGFLQSAITSSHCPTSTEVWQAADSSGSFLGPSSTIMVICDCECSTVSYFSGLDYSTPAERATKGRDDYERILGVLGEGGRPLYQAFSGQVCA